MRNTQCIHLPREDPLLFKFHLIRVEFKSLDFSLTDTRLNSPLATPKIIFRKHTQYMLRASTKTKLHTHTHTEHPAEIEELRWNICLRT